MIKSLTAALAVMLAGCLSVPGGDAEREADCCRPVDDAGCDWVPVTYEVPRLTEAFDNPDRACRELGLEPYRSK